MSTLAAVRLVTGPVRPPGKHGCPPVELLPGLWTAHFEDVATLEQLRAAAPGVALVVNTADDKCKTSEGSYGTDIHVLVVGGLLDDPEERKHVDAMAEGPAKDAARAALPTFPAAECAGDAKKDFTRVNEAVEQALARGEGAVIRAFPLRGLFLPGGRQVGCHLAATHPKKRTLNNAHALTHALQTATRPSHDPPRSCWPSS